MRDGTVTAVEKTGLPEKIRVCLGNGCFIAGTLVTTRSGLKPIEEIAIGDYVLSRNEETGETSYKKVTDTLVRSTQEICTIELETGKIKSTTGHLFMVKDKWWKPAVELMAGDVLETVNGQCQVVKSIIVEEKGYPVTTYNLTVEDNHTFFVNDEGVLTHNMNNVLKGCNFDTEVSEKLTKEVNKASKNGSCSGFRYEHNPSDNPKVLQDAFEDSTAVYGYSPNPNSKSIGDYANSAEKRIDWSNPENVADYQRRREIYHMKNDNIDELVIKMKKEGFSTEEIARAANMQRNQNRLNDYIVNNDMEGLARVKKRNLIKYGNEFGLDADDAYEMYGSWEKVLEKSKSANPGMDACCGLYDKYYHLYEVE